MPATLPDRTQSICQIECLILCQIECQVIFDGRTNAGVHVRTHTRTEVGPHVTAHVRQETCQNTPTKMSEHSQERFAASMIDDVTEDARASVRTSCQAAQVAFQGGDHSKYLEVKCSFCPLWGERLGNRRLMNQMYDLTAEWSETNGNGPLGTGDQSK